MTSGRVRCWRDSAVSFLVCPFTAASVHVMFAEQEYLTDTIYYDLGLESLESPLSCACFRGSVGGGRTPPCGLPLAFLCDTLLVPTQVAAGLCRAMKCELLRFSLICSRHWHSSMAPSLLTTMLRPTMRSCFSSAPLGADLDKSGIVVR